MREEQGDVGETGGGEGSRNIRQASQEAASSSSGDVQGRQWWWGIKAEERRASAQRRQERTRREAQGLRARIHLSLAVDGAGKRIVGRDCIMRWIVRLGR